MEQLLSSWDEFVSMCHWKNEELQSVSKLDETLNNLGKMVKEGNGTGRVVEMIRDIAFAIIKGYISRLAETTHLQSHTEPKDQPS